MRVLAPPPRDAPLAPQAVLNSDAPIQLSTLTAGLGFEDEPDAFAFVWCALVLPGPDPMTFAKKIMPAVQQ